ncbi:FecR family protein [Chitinimonas naiadis]
MPRPKNSSSAKSLSGILASLVMMLGAPMAYAANAGTVTQLAGVMTAEKANGALKILDVQSSVESGDLLATNNNTYARIKFSDGGELTLRPNTQLRIDDYRFDQAKPQEDNAFFRLIKGGLRAVTGLVGKRNNLDAYRMATPTATIGIRGTHYGALFCQSDCGGIPTPSGSTPANGLHVDVTQGAIIISNPGGSQLFNAGQFGFVAAPNTPPVIMPQSPSTSFTPPPFFQPAGSTPSDPSGRKTFECVVD